jgi:glycosyltransferase involved in cell wall biosynthesis
MDEMLNHLERVDAFRRELNVPDDRVLVTVGHNGNPANNHLPIIEALSRLSASEKAAAVWVFPLSYRNNESHIRAVAMEAAAAGLEFRLLTRFLDWQQLAAFRIATDILIHLPISDALSSTVMEVIYAGNCVITGSWLPYGLFRKARLPLLTVEDFVEIPSCISETLLRLGTLKREATEARQRIREHFFAEAAVPPWVEIYRRLLGLSAA